MVNLSKYEQIIIWGACFTPNEIGEKATSHGYAAEKLYNMLEQNGYFEKVIFFVDSNTKLHGFRRFGKIVKSPDEILNYPDALIVINSLSICSIMSDIENKGLDNEVLIIPYYFYHGVLEHPYDNTYAKKVVSLYQEEIKSMFCIDDKETSRYLDIIFELRNKGVDDLYSKEFYDGTGTSLDYFCDDLLSPKGSVTYVDVGAFQGESIEPIRKKYGERLKYCMAFEPDGSSVSELEKYINDNKLKDVVEIYPYALGDEEREIRFIQAGSTSQESLYGENIIFQKRFDDLCNKKIIGDAMVKMDIEGAEMGALKGMEEFIKTHKPYLAICLYHKEDDIYKIPKYIKELYNGYRLYIRGGWHLECWAIPERHFR